MNNWTLSVILLACLLKIFIPVNALPSTVDVQQAISLKSCCTLSVINNSRSYILGEIVDLEIRLTNTLEDVVWINSLLPTSFGNFDIYISNDNVRYRRNMQPLWGVKDYVIVHPTTLDAHKSESIKISVLYNSIGDDHINEVENRVTTSNLFPMPGIYYIKAILKDYTRERRETLESAPIQINILQPKGDDLQIWNTIKDNPQFAFFLQESVIHEDLETEKYMIQTLEDLTQTYPKGKLASQIRRALDKFYKDYPEKVRLIID